MTIYEKIAKKTGVDKSVVRLIIEAYTSTRAKKKKGAKARGPYQHIKSGYQKDLDVAVRSGWEGNFLRFLTVQGLKWIYEPQTFYYEGKRGRAGMYTLDVYLPDLDLWIEVKGYLRKGDQLKIRRFREFYPEEFAKLRVVIKNSKVKAAKFFEKMGVPVFIYYEDIEKFKDAIPGFK